MILHLIMGQLSKLTGKPGEQKSILIIRLPETEKFYFKNLSSQISNHGRQFFYAEPEFKQKCSRINRIRKFILMEKISDLKGFKTTLIKLQKRGKPIILTGGCFDILHIGHIRFLEEAKKSGGTLIVLLEPDEKVRKLKGAKRPVFSQHERARTLSSLIPVDYIILLPYLSGSGYDQYISVIKPDIIAKNKNQSNFEKETKTEKKSSGKPPRFKIFQRGGFPGIFFGLFSF